MNHLIVNAVRTFSPKHSTAVLDAVKKLPGQDIAAAAGCIRETLEGFNVLPDIRNPFKAGTDEADAWARGWDGEPETVNQPDYPDFTSMTKTAIDEWAADHGIDLDRRKSKAAMIDDLNEALAA